MHFPKYTCISKCQILRQTSKILWRFYKYTRHDVCKLKNTTSNLKQDKQKLYILKTLPVRLQKKTIYF